MISLPLTEDARWALIDEGLQRIPAPVLVRCAAGAALQGDWRDVCYYAGLLCEKAPLIFHLYCRARRVLAPLAPLGELARDLAWACSFDSDSRAIGRVLVGNEAQLAALRARRALRAFRREYARHMLAWRWQAFCDADRGVQAVALAALLWLALALSWALLTARP